jgi:hypothetical protein
MGNLEKKFIGKSYIEEIEKKDKEINSNKNLINSKIFKKKVEEKLKLF